MQGNNKIGQRIYGRKRGQKELDGMFHADGKKQRRKRKAHKKAIETKVRQDGKKICRQY